MSNIAPIRCPLCNGPAQQEIYLLRRLTHVLCSTCNDVVIKDRAASWLASASQQAREHFSAEARRAPQESALVIVRSPGRDPENPSVRGSFMPLAEALHQ